MIELFNAALMLNQSAMRGLRESPDVVRRGMLVVLLVGMLVGAAQGASALINSATPERAVAGVRAQVDEFVEGLTLGANSEQFQPLIQLVNENEEQLYSLLLELYSLPTPLPWSAQLGFRWLASVVSTPLSYLAGLLVTVVVTHVAARQLGGQGSIQQMLGLGALSTAPHALDALTFIPGIGPTLGFIAWGWGLAILVVGTMVAHKLDSGRATMAVLLYPLLLSLLGLVAFCGLLFLAAATVGG